MKLIDNRSCGQSRMVCMCCGWAWMVAVELRHNAHRKDQALANAYLCLDCVRAAALEADECHGDPESDGSDA